MEKTDFVNTSWMPRAYLGVPKLDDEQVAAILTDPPNQIVIVDDSEEVACPND